MSADTVDPAITRPQFVTIPSTGNAGSTREAIRSTLRMPTGSVATASTLLAGVRAGTATVVPILFAYATAYPPLIWTALGGWLSTFADSGGAYRVRARHLAAFAVAGTVACFAAALAARAPIASVVLVMAWAAGGAFIRIYGDGAASIGSLVAVTFVAALGSPVDLRAATLRALLFLAGCAWATLLTLFVWPLRPWQPARRAIGECYANLARYAHGMSEAIVSAPRGGRPWHDLAIREHAAIRQSIEAARTTLGETRRSRAGSSRRGEDLIVLLESAEQLFETLVASGDQVEATARAASAVPEQPASVASNDDELLGALRGAVDALGDVLAGLADALPVIGHWKATPTPAAHAADRAVLALWDAVERDPDPLGPRASVARHAAALLEHAATLADTGAEAAASLVTGSAPPARPLRGDDLPIEDELTTPQPNAWTIVRANLSFDSLALRHALRIAIVAGLATWIGFAEHLPHATWVTTTALIVLQPYAGLTQRRGVERLTWTMLGGIVAALLAALVHDRFVIAAVMFPLAVAAIAVRASHYGLYTFFLTPVFVLLAEPAPGVWSLAIVRALDTLLGGVMALVASRFLWPSWEHRRLPTELATMIDALRRYFRTVESVAVGAGVSTPGALGAARRGVGLASNNVDAAIQRLVAEPQTQTVDLESVMTMLAYVRRMAGSLTAIAVGGGTSRPSGAEHVALAAALDTVLADIADAVRSERQPAPLPDIVDRLLRSRSDASSARSRRALRTTLELPAIGNGLERIARQAGVLHGAASRVFATRPADGDVRIA